jgi:hypothetical protein
VSDRYRYTIRYMHPLLRVAIVSLGSIAFWLFFLAASTVSFLHFMCGMLAFLAAVIAGAMV